MKVSLLYVTNRPGGMDILKGNLDRQTFRDFEVIMVDGRARDMAMLTVFLNGVGPHFRQFCEPRPGVWGAHNEGLRHCAGELVVFLQDYIWIRADGIARFVAAQETRPGFYTGIGNVGEGPERVQDGELTIWRDFYYGPPERVRWEDPRLGGWQGEIVEVTPDLWENNWACAPRDALIDLGGFDEGFESGWGWAEKDLAARAQMLGHKLYMDTGNRCMAWYHDSWWPNTLKSKAVQNEMLYNNLVAELKSGRRAPRLSRGGEKWPTLSTT